MPSGLALNRWYSETKATEPARIVPNHSGAVSATWDAIAQIASTATITQMLRI
jgi:D-serine deaminase-like pyridoxal phosphate-dependent protein